MTMKDLFNKRVEKTLLDLKYVCHGTARSKGFWDTPREIGTMIALCHSELSEALEAARLGNMDGKDGVSEELADTIIRILDMAGGMGLDVESAIVRKINFNKSRPYKHGKLF